MNWKRINVLVSLGLIVAAVAMQALYIIDEREQALVTMFGQPIRTVREPGL